MKDTAAPVTSRASPHIWDAVVIGAGHNGLVTAGYLARSGRMGLNVRRLGRADMQEFLRLMLINIHDVTEEELSDDRLRGLLAFDATLGAWLGPRSPNSLFLLWHRLSGDGGRIRWPRGGMGALASALADAVRASGAELRCAARVERVLTDGEQITGVRLESGEEIAARRVISTANPRTGFTGDLGYELWVDPDRALALWDHLVAAGRPHGLRPVGTEAVNIARIEAGFIIANMDFIAAEQALRPDRTRLPDEIGLGWMVDVSKGPFNGRSAIRAARSAGTLRWALVGLDVEGNIPADGAVIYLDGKTEVGQVTAAAWSPTTKRNLALAQIRRPWDADAGERLRAEVYALRELQYHKLMLPARIARRPFFNPPRRRATPPAMF